ncbi:MAG: ATP-dependent helicase DinG, partial [Frankiaceae bacterium]|nr:ATP-dependent helicase DinG [Frankiaceae bacterium]
MTGLPAADETLAAAVEAMAGGEPRTGQRAMAQAIAGAIKERRHLLVQAGTGTGKSLAYLVPAICSGERVVVSTATKSLQEQLVGKDLPELAATLTDRFGVGFDFALLKGRSNYYCRVRGETAADDPEMAMYDADSASEVAAVVRWATDSDTGDRSDLATPVSDKVWRAVSMPPGECPGRTKCGRADECFAEHARDRAGLADVVVVNHHLLALHLMSAGNLLPDHAVTVIDEAHDFADIVTDVVGATCTPASLERLITRCAAHLPAEDATTLEQAVEAFGDALRGAPPGRLRSLPSAIAGSAVTARAALARVLDLLKTSNTLGGTEDDDAKMLALRHLVLMVIETLDRAQAGSADDVVWVERGGQSSRDTRLRVAPLDVGRLLASDLFSATTVVATSATLAVAGGFDIPARRLGLEEPAAVADADRPNPFAWDGIDVGSPFDFARQGMLYIPRDFPAPQGATATAHAAAVVDELVTLINAAGGRTLALFTTTRAVTEAAAA